MKFKQIALMALAFAASDKMVAERLNLGFSYKQSLYGTRFQNVNVGNNPIFIPSKKMQINRKRLLKRLK